MAATAHKLGTPAKADAFPDALPARAFRTAAKIRPHGDGPAPVSVKCEARSSAGRIV
jgi:hypothetical protein